MDIAEPISTSATTPLSFIPRAVVPQECSNPRRNAQSFEPEPHARRHLIKREDDVEMGGIDETLVAVKREEVDEDLLALPTQSEEMSRGRTGEPEWLWKRTDDGITFYLPTRPRRRNRHRYIQPEVEEELVEVEREMEMEDRTTIPDQHTLGIQVYQQAREAAEYYDLRYQVKTTSPPNPFMPATLRSLQSPITSLLPPKMPSNN